MRWLRRLGWRMPWSMRARIAEVLLGCLFEGPEGGDKIQDADALLKVCFVFDQAAYVMACQWVGDVLASL